MVAAATIKVSYAPEHEVYERQVTADTAVLQHLHHPSHGWGWMLFFQARGGHRVEDYFIPDDRADVDHAVAAAKRRLDVQQHAIHRTPKPHSGTTPAIGNPQRVTKTRCS